MLVEILVKNLSFGRKSKCWSKIEMLVKYRNFGRKQKSWSKKSKKMSKKCLKQRFFLPTAQAGSLCASVNQTRRAEENAMAVFAVFHFWMTARFWRSLEIHYLMKKRVNQRESNNNDACGLSGGSYVAGEKKRKKNS